MVRALLAIAPAVLAAAAGLAHADDPVPWVDAADAGSALVDAVAAARPDQAAAGDLVRVAITRKVDDVDAADRALRAVLDAAGLTVVDDAGRPGQRVALTVADARGVRAVITLSPWGGDIAVIAAPRTWKAPGRCRPLPARTHDVTVSATGVNQDGDVFHSSTPWKLATTRFADVDGDGVLDALVPRFRAHQCPDDGSWEVFVMRGTCGHFVGLVGRGTITIADPSAPIPPGGLRALQAASQSARHGARGIPEMTTTTVTWSYRGKSYRKAGTRTRTGTCHHCSVWRCH